MSEILSALLMVIGGLLMLLSAVGIVRMPDLLTRLQVSTKASTLGVGCTLLAVAIYFGELGIIVRALAAMTFFFITVPVAAHMIARSAYFIGVPLWEGTVIDELQGRYNPNTHILESPPNPGVSKTTETKHPGSSPKRQ